MTYPKNIPFSQHSITQSDISSVLKSLKSPWLSSGPKVAEFEGALKKCTGAQYCVALNSGTMALHLTMLGLNITKGHRIVTSPITFAASANCAVYVGAVPHFVDVNRDTVHLDVEQLKKFLKQASHRKNVKAVILVHFMGTVGEVVEINKLCQKYGIDLIEDAAHALGSAYQNEGCWHRVGCCSHSQATIFSFHPVKNITTGEGGAVCTNNRILYERILSLRHHGLRRGHIDQKSALYSYKDEQWFSDMPEIGFNGRITDFQCALGISQLKKINHFIKRRRQLFEQYQDALSQISQIQIPYERIGSKGAYHIYPIRVPADKRSALYSYLKEKNILTQVHYVPVHLYSFYQKIYGYGWGDFPNAEGYFKECLSLPLHVNLKDREQNYIIKEIQGFFK